MNMSVTAKTIRTVLVLTVTVFVIIPVGDLHGASRNLVHLIEVNTLSQAPIKSLVAGETGHSVNPMVAELAERLRERLRATLMPSQEGASTSRLSAEHTDTRDRSRERLRTDLEIRIRSLTRTPSQIKGLQGTALMQAEPSRTPGLARDKKTARKFLQEYRHILRLNNPEEELQLRRDDVDRLGRSHLRFSQVYKKLPVWPSEVIVHLDLEGHVDVMNGSFVPTPRRMITSPVVSAETAVEQARAAIPDGAEAEASTPRLIIYAPGDRPPRLAWKIELTASIVSHWLVVIDAMSSITLTAFNQVMDANVSGAGIDLFGATQPLNVWAEEGTFFMADTSKPMFDPALSPLSSSTTKGSILILDAVNQDPDDEEFEFFFVTSESGIAWSPRDAVSAAFGLSETYDYFLERHGRNSLDGQRGMMIGVVRIGQDLENAFWNGQFLGFGDAMPFAGALDVVAHELTHAVTDHSAKLLYRNQPGALNEAFSDIFGEAVEARSFGEADWVNGGQLEEPTRSLIDPSSLEICPGCGRNYPVSMSEFIGPQDSFLGRFEGRDNGGVHINSSIINHAFYLLAEGLDGAIGILDAERIFYQALVFHLTPNSQFVDARLACIQSAEELFGDGSPQALKTAEAFDAVGVVDAPPTPETTPFPSVSGPDATLFVSFLPESGESVLRRREEALGDGPSGVAFTGAEVIQARPAVVGDGSFAVYVNAANDVCFIDTDGGSPECLGFSGFVSSVAVSPDGTRVGFILLDPSGNPEDEINVLFVDEETDADRTFSLIAPALDGVSTNTIQQADAMDFTADKRFLVYDAFNVMTFTDGSRRGLWSIYAIDLDTNTTLTLLPPIPGVDLAFPALSQTGDNIITFDAFDIEAGQSTVVAANLNSGDRSDIGEVIGDFGVPGYNGDDTAIIFMQDDPTTPTGFSLVRQPLAPDQITPIGEPEVWLRDAGFGVIYRRGTFVGPTAPDLTGISRLAGTATGITPTKIICKNKSVDPQQKVRVDGDVPAVWNCGKMGLTSAPGDTVQVKIVGTVDAVMEVGGSVTGLTPTLLVCKNRSTEPQAKLRIEDPPSPWSCDDPEFPMAPGDVVQMKVTGVALPSDEGG